VAERLADRLAGGDVPDLRGLVGAGGDDARAVRAEGGGGDAVAMLEGISEGLAGARVPDPGGVVVAGGDDARAVWAERGGGDAVAMLARYAPRVRRCASWL